MSDLLTAFQIDVERDLADAGFHVIDRQVEGEEPYIAGRLVSPECRLWIYQDEVQIETSTAHRYFEQPDFDSLNHLRAEFLRFLTELAGRDQQHG